MRLACSTKCEFSVASQVCGWVKLTSSSPRETAIWTYQSIKNARFVSNANKNMPTIPGNRSPKPPQSSSRLILIAAASTSKQRQMANRCLLGSANAARCMLAYLRCHPLPHVFSCNDPAVGDSTGTWCAVVGFMVFSRGFEIGTMSLRSSKADPVRQVLVLLNHACGW